MRMDSLLLFLQNQSVDIKRNLTNFIKVTDSSIIVEETKIIDYPVYSVQTCFDDQLKDNMIKLKSLLKEMFDKENDEIIPKGETSSIQVTARGNRLSRTIVMYSNRHGDCHLDLRAVEGARGIYTLINGAANEQDLPSFYLTFLETIFKNNASNMVEFTDKTGQYKNSHVQSKSTTAITYGVFKGVPDDFAKSVKDMALPLLDNDTISTFEYRSTFDNSKSETIHSKHQSQEEETGLKKLYHELGVLKYAAEAVLKDYPKLLAFALDQLDQHPKNVTMKSKMPPAPPIKGDWQAAYSNLQDDLEQYSYAKLMKAVIQMDDDTLKRFDALPQFDDGSYYQKYEMNL